MTHQTVYQALYVQGRGALRRELTRALRTGRVMRRPHRHAYKRVAGPIRNMVTTGKGKSGRVKYMNSR
ncbi:hypothetical protein ACFT9I_01410 [Streptomyces sp. NPDC057137]|uniref:hypothetical protein n=1 Tax=Streptomyces sp. NPDC057137 TaxID=3346030 RepID=UPI00364155B2